MEEEQMESAEIDVGANVDVRKLMGEIRAEVDRKRRAGLYPVDVLEELDVLMATSEDGDDSLRNAMLVMRQSAVFSPAVSTASRKGPLAPVAASFKRAVRGSTSWYVSGILQQVELFAAHAIRVIGLLTERVRRVEDRLPDGVLEEIRREFGERLDAAGRRVDKAHEVYEALIARIETLETEGDLVRREWLPMLERSVRGLRQRVVETDGTPERRASAPARGSLEIDVALDYLAFENRFRGSEETIRNQQRSYVELFTDRPGPVVDLGCGRGEFLELLVAAGVDAYGVDQHADMIDLCREKELDAREADALEHLASVQGRSLGGIFSAQMIEHLEMRDVPRLFELAADALALGGRLVVETINPESLFVFAAAFYVDLGHLRPLHPLTLRYLAEKSGFADVDVRYSSPPPPELRPATLRPSGTEPLDAVIDSVNENFRRLDQVVFGPQDYALIATR